MSCSIPEFSENKRRKDTSEGKIVRHDIFAIYFSSTITNVIKLGTFRIDLDQIDSRCEPFVIHHANTDPGLESAAGTQCMACIAL